MIPAGSRTSVGRRRHATSAASFPGEILKDHGTRICPVRSRHSAGIGWPASSRRNQSSTSSKFVSRPEIVMIKAFRTFAAASAARRLSKTAAYGDLDIHQTTRKWVRFADPKARFGLDRGAVFVSDI